MLVAVKWYVAGVLICISLMANYVSHFSCDFWPFVYLLWSNVEFRSFAYLLIGLFVFLLGCRSSVNTVSPIAFAHLMSLCGTFW